MDTSDTDPAANKLASPETPLSGVEVDTGGSRSKMDAVTADGGQTDISPTTTGDKTNSNPKVSQRK